MTLDIFQAIKDRRSIRKYKETPVEEEKIEQILGAARLAPS
jgi:nitroreductase